MYTRMFMCVCVYNNNFNCQTSQFNHHSIKTFAYKSNQSSIASKMFQPIKIKYNHFSTIVHVFAINDDDNNY